MLTFLKPLSFTPIFHRQVLFSGKFLGCWEPLNFQEEFRSARCEEQEQILREGGEVTVDGFRLGLALGIAEYPRIAHKIVTRIAEEHPGNPKFWCNAEECRCRGCANQYLSWTEYDCWQRHQPAVDSARASYAEVKAAHPRLEPLTTAADDAAALSSRAKRTQGGAELAPGLGDE